MEISQTGGTHAVENQAPPLTPYNVFSADLPLQGEGQPTTQSMAAAIAFVLRAHDFRAGRFRLALQTCDDSTAASAERCTVIRGSPSGARVVLITCIGRSR